MHDRQQSTRGSDEDAVIVGTCLEQQDPVLRVRREPVGQHAAGRAAANDDKVVLTLGRHCYSAPARPVIRRFLPVRLAARTNGRNRFWDQGSQSRGCVQSQTHHVTIEKQHGACFATLWRFDRIMSDLARYQFILSTHMYSGPVSNFGKCHKPVTRVPGIWRHFLRSYSSYI